MEDNTGLLKFGFISEIDTNKGLAKVNFKADNFVSDWISPAFKKTLNDKESFPFDQDEHVVCLMDLKCDTGVIIGAVYADDADAPALTGSFYGVKFSNGDTFKYDKQNQIFTTTVKNTTISTDGTTIKATTVGGVDLELSQSKFTIKTAAGNLKDVLNDIISETSNGLFAVGIGSSASGTAAQSAFNTAIASTIAKISAMFN